MIMVEEIKQHLNWIKSLHEADPKGFSKDRVIDEGFGFCQGIMYYAGKCGNDDLEKEMSHIWTDFYENNLHLHN